MFFTRKGKFRLIRHCWAAALFALSVCFPAGPIKAQTGDTIEQMNDLVVTAQYHAQSLRKSVYNVSIIDKKRIEASGATDIRQLLSTFIGIRFSSDAALGVSDIALMGMGGRNIKILLDGVPLVDRGDMRESLNQIDITQIERIEIVEGPMSIVYGSDALAGVINIITQNPHCRSFNINARVQEESAGSEYSPFKKKGLHTQQIGGGLDNGKWNAAASLMHYDFSGFGADANGRAHSWKPKEQWMPFVRAGYRTRNWHMYYRNDYLHETIMAQGPINWDTYKAITQKFVTSRMAHQLQGNYMFGPKWSLNAVAGYTNYRRSTHTTQLDFREGTETLTTGKGQQDTVKLHAFNFRSTLQYVHSEKLAVQPGIEISYEKALGGRIKGSPSIANYSFFISAEYKPVQKLNIRPGFRVNKNTLYAAPPFVPSVNVLYNIADNFSLRAAYARGYRAPALRELYFDFQDANHNLKGNANLKAEKSRSLNLSINFVKKVTTQSTFSVELAGFYNTFDNLINMGVNPANKQENIYLNIDKYKTTGLSLKNTVSGKNFSFQAGCLLLGQYNKLSNTDLAKEKMPAFNKSFEANAEAMYQIEKTKTAFSFLYKYTGRRINYEAVRDNSGNVTAAPVFVSGFHYADASVQQRIGCALKATAGVHNLFNITSILSTTTSGSGPHGSSGPIVLAYGRSFFLSIQYNFTHYLKNKIQ